MEHRGAKLSIDVLLEIKYGVVDLNIFSVFSATLLYSRKCSFDLRFESLRIRLRPGRD